MKKGEKTRFGLLRSARGARREAFTTPMKILHGRSASFAERAISWNSAHTTGESPVSALANSAPHPPGHSRFQTRLPSPRRSPTPSPPPLHRSRSRVAVRGKGARKRALAVICFPSAYRQRPAAAMCQQRKVIFAYSFWSRRSRVGGGREGGREFRACVCCASSMLFGCASEIENLVWPRRRRRRRSPDAEIRKKTVGESRTPPELTTCHPLADSCRGRSLLG